MSVETHTIGPHTPTLRPEDIQLTHRLWLQLTHIPELEKLHHSEIISLALARLARDFKRHEHEIIAEFKNGKGKRLALPTPVTPEKKPPRSNTND